MTEENQSEDSKVIARATAFAERVAASFLAGSEPSKMEDIVWISMVGVMLIASALRKTKSDAEDQELFRKLSGICAHLDQETQGSLDRFACFASHNTALLPTKLAMFANERSPHAAAAFVALGAAAEWILRQLELCDPKFDRNKVVPTLAPLVQRACETIKIPVLARVPMDLERDEKQEN